jgi:hypothetical protein
MKKLLILLAVSCLLFTVHSANAQIMKDYSNLLSKTTLTNTDTSLFIYQPENNTKSIEVAINKTSGTIGGKVYMYVSVDAINYDVVDSLTVTDVSVNKKIFHYAGTLGSLDYYKYKFIYYQTTTGVSVPKFYVLKR